MPSAATPNARGALAIVKPCRSLIEFSENFRIKEKKLGNKTFLKIVKMFQKLLDTKTLEIASIVLNMHIAISFA